MDAINTADAPESIGPFSQAIVDDGTVYVSGQGPVNPDTGDVEVESIEDQTARTLENIDAILEEAGTSLENVVKADVYVTDMGDYDAVNEAYAEYVSEPYPARCAVEMSDLPIDIGVEIEVVAKL
ncbi:RidA family protein [Natronococcus sp. JC468]|uniref:RidA family protein n=1 Tax=Natronococcus sp. JC468 TaxID=1961921 RepID=UPI00143A66FC|nr:Rid family detoxifying hydrolase [Natronococcus sp. JC468]NKE36097.1 RidA family protein [Natronococcus sp. JC468]